MKSQAAIEQEKRLNDLIQVPVWDQNISKAGAKPGAKTRVWITGATVVDVDQANPTDGGTLVNTGGPLFNGISSSDINQGQRSNCYQLAVLASLARSEQGRAHLKSRVYYDPSNLQKVVVVYERNGLVTRIHCDLLVSTWFNQTGEDHDLWVELCEKTYALYRSGSNSYGSLDWGFCGAVMMDMGLTGVGSEYGFMSGNVARMKTRFEGQMCCTLMTPGGDPGFNLVGSHAYSLEEVATGILTFRNPWGTSGGVLMCPLTEPNISTSGVSMQYALIPDAPVVLADSPTCDARVGATKNAVLNLIESLRGK